jgi:hypothetical protein
MPKVARKEGIPTFATKIPFINPIRNPDPSPPKILIKMFPVERRRSAVISEDNATTEPKERSISPVASTKVMPIAIIEIMAVCLAIFIKFLPDRNAVSKSKIEKSKIMPAKMK